MWSARLTARWQRTMKCASLSADHWEVTRLFPFIHHLFGVLPSSLFYFFVLSLFHRGYLFFGISYGSNRSGCVKIAPIDTDMSTCGSQPISQQPTQNKKKIISRGNAKEQAHGHKKGAERIWFRPFFRVIVAISHPQQLHDVSICWESLPMSPIQGPFANSCCTGNTECTQHTDEGTKQK